MVLVCLFMLVLQLEEDNMRFFLKELRESRKNKRVESI